METEVIDFLLILFTIISFTIVQSVFGVGLLVFGTPTLLLLGYSFPETLAYLLPSSIVVSFFQVYNRWNQIILYKINVILYLLPTVLIGLLIVLYFLELNLYLIVGLMLFLTSITRISEALSTTIENFFSSNLKIGFLFTGFIHGLTNLGGAPLVILTNGIYKNKIKIQPNIAYAYLFMAIIQIIVLFATSSFVFSEITLILPFVSGVIYLYLGNYLFEIAGERYYHNLMTFFIFVYGLLLILKSF